MNKTGVLHFFTHLLLLLHLGGYRAGQRRCKPRGSHKHVFHLLQYRDSYDSFPESLSKISHPLHL